MTVNCKNFANLIPDFLTDRLDNADLSDFLSHLDSCPACQDELSTQYLLYEGIARLETGGPFDLEKELEEVKRAARKRLALRQRLFSTAAALEIITLALAIVTVYVLVTM